MFNKKAIPLDIGILSAMKEIVSDAVPKLHHISPIVGFADNPLGRTIILARFVTVAIPPTINFWVIEIAEFDKELYKLRHLVENLFARLKHSRSVATRFEKLARNFRAIIFIACTLIWLKVGKCLSCA